MVRAVAARRVLGVPAAPASSTVLRPTESAFANPLRARRLGKRRCTQVRCFNAGSAEASSEATVVESCCVVSAVLVSVVAAASSWVEVDDTVSMTFPAAAWNSLPSLWPNCQVAAKIYPGS